MNSYTNAKGLLFICALFLSLAVSAQEKSGRFTINWLPVLELSQDDQPSRSLNFDGVSYDELFHPRFIITQALYTPTNVQIVLKNITTEPLTDVSALKNPSSIGTEFSVETKIVTRKKINYYSTSILPIRKNGNGFERLVSFDTEVKVLTTNVRMTSTTRNYASGSVLKIGDWYRIAVLQNGLYKLDYAFLKTLGLDVDHLNPKTLQIYGNGGGALAYGNFNPRYDDLQENAIYVEGELDGVFNPSDYVLFYGTGQTRWNYNSSNRQFNHKINLYSDTTYYFITASQAAGKRIQNRASSALQPTNTVTSYDDYFFHEAELTNLIASGREWYGESMDVISNNVSFSVSIPNLSLSDSIFLRSTYAGRAKSSGLNNSFNVKINGNNLGTINFYEVGDFPSDNYANNVSFDKSFFAPSSNLVISATLNSTDANAQAWLNYVELNYRRSLAASGNGGQFPFRDSKSIGPGNISEYKISNNTAPLSVWDITNPLNPVNQLNNFNSGEVSFVYASDEIHEYFAWTGQQFLTPVRIGDVANQNLHGLPQADMLIVTNPLFEREATELAEIHRIQDHLIVHVVTTNQIFNEFSSGAQDVCAIRDFVKMFYDRALSPNTMPHYLLLFGDASYDPKYRVSSNTNYVTAFESAGSINKTQSYISDDFFGLLDDNEGEWTSGELLDLSIGRMPVRSAAEAASMVNKIRHYLTGTTPGNNPSLGNWRNVITFVADDQDNNTHLKQSDTLANRVRNAYPIFNQEKIYLDAFNQETGAGGQRYPDAHAAINNRVEKGTLLITYIGHGNELNWTKERVLEINDINAWTNLDRLAAFLTATCEFSRVDDPSRISAGELVYLNANGGGICMFTTSRLAYSNSNYILCQRFFNHFFEKVNGRNLTCGEIFEQTKIDVYTDTYVRNFILLGDPALKLAFPVNNVVTKTINGVDISLPTDTLKALSKVTITGEVHDQTGNKLTNFNGQIHSTVYDKSQTYTTLGNDASDRSDPSYPQNFILQKNVIYSGKASVINGDFTFSFIVPKDISFQVGNGKLSYYAQNGTSDANGYNTRIYVGGINSTAASDQDGPVIQLYLNDEKFVRGGMTDKDPFLYAIVSDSSGVNMVGTGIGHDITAELDAKSEKRYVLNEYFENDLNSYQKGKVRYQFKALSSGQHTLTFKVWDVYNNSNEATTDFIVSESAKLALDHVLNYPNPFTTRTTFMFEHNRPFIPMDVQVQIFTVSGRLIKTLSDKITPTGYRSDNIQWDGLDDFGDRIGKGVYVYKLRIRTEDGEYADKFEKLVILR